MNKRTLAWFIPLMIPLILLVVCVVLLGTTDLVSTIQDYFDPAVSSSISGLDRLPDGERVQVEGCFHYRDEWIVIGYDYDCVNYFLSENRLEPYGDAVDLCIQRGRPPV